MLQKPNNKSIKNPHQKEKNECGKKTHFITQFWCYKFSFSNLSLTHIPPTKIMTGNLQFAPFQHGMLQKFMSCMVQAQFTRLDSAARGISQAGQAIHHKALAPNGQTPQQKSNLAKWNNISPTFPFQRATFCIFAVI